MLKKIKVLFVEDEALAREKLAKVLRAILGEVVTAENGQKALDIYNSNPTNESFDLIVSDINMPIMNGLELAKNIRESNQEIPIIFITARNETEYLLESIELNINHYILKPINIDNLVEKIKLVCEKILMKKALEVKKIEVDNLLNTLDNFAGVSIFNTDGKITYVNDIYCEVSKYTQEELIGMSIKDIICLESNKIAFDNLWRDINQGLKWKGNLKKFTKNKEEIYVNIFIMPIRDELNSDIKEFIAIQYVTTEEEIKKRESTRKLYSSLMHFKKKEYENKKLLESFQKKSEEKEVGIINQEKLKLLVKKIKTLQSQINHTEEEMKKTKEDSKNIITRANLKVTEVIKSRETILRETSFYKDKYKECLEDSKQRQKTINDLEERIKEKNKKIDFLYDVISSKENKIEQLLLGTD